MLAMIYKEDFMKAFLEYLGSTVKLGLMATTVRCYKKLSHSRPSSCTLLHASLQLVFLCILYTTILLYPNPIVHGKQKQSIVTGLFIIIFLMLNEK